ncbi:protein of unknown function (plasmid) [Magnetospirillum sp. XM-1]|uniref:hypothetical protein n=1 Tax=unclassified Magnetospirillum TaxID=2617991 RepID=UPI00073E0617|nr:MULTISPECIES: hypothetical protein [unclassified Magnetospirillum]ARJ66036.1 hypothetical protein WV31_10395 [Magnetospirillum sp. ME-1]CUW41966.1 protein of unknown function [Magnetospirillum sp. XM-1]
MTYLHAVDLDWEEFPLPGAVPPSPRNRDRIRTLARAVRDLPEDSEIGAIVDACFDLAKALDEDGADAAAMSFGEGMAPGIRDKAIPILSRALEGHGIMPLQPIMTPNGIALEEDAAARGFLIILAETDPKARCALWRMRWTDAKLDAADARAKRGLPTPAKGRPEADEDLADLAADILNDRAVDAILRHHEPALHAELATIGRPCITNERPWIRKLGRLRLP